MIWREIIIRLRRYLRDPDGLIWTDAELLQYFNESALEIAVKTGFLTRVETYPYPPEFDGSFMFDWEADFGEGLQYQCLTINQADGFVICFPWEAAYWLDTVPSADEGYRDTHPWEMVLGSPADIIPVPLHAKFQSMKLACFDEEPITPIDEKTLALQDPFYRSREGKPLHYWHISENSNLIAIYPKPSVVWDETAATEVLADTGGVITSEDWLTQADTGLTTDIILLEDRLFCAYEAMPTALVSEDDSPDLVPYLVKYVEYATLERAFGADTDGFIPTLRDYWGMRKKVGIEAVKKHKRLALTNRDYRLGGGLPQVRSRHPRLPEHYPAVT